MEKKKKEKEFLATEFSSNIKFGGNTLLDICTKIDNIADYVSLNLGDEETAQKLDQIGIDVQKYVKALTEGIDAFTFRREGIEWKESMMMWDNNGNSKMPEKICVKNIDGSSSSIRYDAQKWLYENLFKDSFFKHLPEDVKKKCKGNHGFKIEVPFGAIYPDDHYTIRGFRNAVMFAHTLMLATASPIVIKDMNCHPIVTIYILDGYYINNYLGEGDVKWCLLMPTLQ